MKLCSLVLCCAIVMNIFCCLELLNASLTSSSNMQHLACLTLWMYQGHVLLTHSPSEFYSWVVEVLEWFLTLGRTLSLFCMPPWSFWWHTEQSLVYVCFTNNLFIIAKCMYATPDPVQPDHQYLPVCTTSVPFVLLVLVSCHRIKFWIIYWSYLLKFCYIGISYEDRGQPICQSMWAN